MTPPPGGRNGAGTSQDDEQQRQSWSPSPALSKLQALLGFVSGDGQQLQSRSSTVFDSPTPANRPAPRPSRGSGPTNLGSNTHSDNDYDGVFQPPSDSYASLVQAQGSYLQPQQAQADTPDVQFLQAEIDRAREKQSKASKGTLRQIFPGVDEEVPRWVLEESEGQSERSIETLLGMTSGG